jgi:hypothetical protein
VGGYGALDDEAYYDDEYGEKMDVAFYRSMLFDGRAKK